MKFALKRTAAHPIMRRSLISAQQKTCCIFRQREKTKAFERFSLFVIVRVFRLPWELPIAIYFSWPTLFFIEVIYRHTSVTEWTGKRLRTLLARASDAAKVFTYWRHVRFLGAIGAHQLQGGTCAAQTASGGRFANKICGPSLRTGATCYGTTIADTTYSTEEQCFILWTKKNAPMFTELKK